MLDCVVRHQDLLALIDELGRHWRLVGPVARETPGCEPPMRWFYEPAERAEQMDLGFPYCVFAPKSFLLPSHETLFRFNRQSRGFEATPVFSNQRIALVGVHPCDVHSIALLDHVFSVDIPDEHYRARREHMLIVGMDCPRPCTGGVFCRDMDCNHAENGFDVMLYPLDAAQTERETPLPQQRYGVVFGSRAGRSWMLHSELAARVVSPDALDERDMATYLRRKEAAFPFGLTTKRADLAKLLGHSYDSLLWEATGRRCYSCGSCNLVCPTCYCFDIQERTGLSLEEGARERTWDGCQLKDFAVVAGDHNFRPKAGQRLRHRIFRKGMWIEQRTGLAGCTGCARCDRACTARINSVEIYNQLAEEE